MDQRIPFFILIPLVTSALVAGIIMPALLSLCRRHNIYDHPDARKVHQSNVPRMGGVVFVPSVAVGMATTLYVMLSQDGVAETIKMRTLLVGCGILLIYFIGVLDDIFCLSARVKLVVQILAAMAFPMAGLYLTTLYGLFGVEEIPYCVGAPLTVLCVLTVVNAVNMIDGIDGLASSLAIVAFAAFTAAFAMCQNYIFCIFAAALIGALVVFLRYNMFGRVERGTKTFMGDSGSLMLGFSLSYLAIKYSMQNAMIPTPRWSLLLAFSVLLVPCFDLVRVSVSRAMRGIHPFAPDKTHIHHKLLQLGLTMHRALAVIVIADLLFIALNMSLYCLGLGYTPIVCLDICLFSLGQWWLNRRLLRQ